ncbi:sulfatase-like hydrolase/transferase [Arenibacter palladensis]|uniref:sulfatase-like hydrolase/transferase n=1 Tax=Arenibacter palladensis TaxID=237373 RepID=UPI0026E13042|nr:sulfatase-like hydrolase/transferase [Arenibacter palladensis]MDO6602852.1 sulfatase-like hydrolase/transferase [Arenibacter palladensis]
MNRANRNIVSLILVLGFFGYTYSQGKTAMNAPNFVIILTDDQGWNALSTRMDPDISESGSTYYQTPNLDKFAKEGMRFSRAYSSAPTCAPTRHSIQFGRSPASLQIWGADNINDFDAKANESLAHILRSNYPDYKAAHYGKWHVGQGPEILGYEFNDGNNKNIKRSSDPDNDPKHTFSLSDKATNFMQNRVDKGEPFLLQVSYFANHLFFEAKKETLEKYTYGRSNLKTPYHNNAVWAAMNEDLDTGIGLIFQKINQLGIEDNTYIIFTSDNGYEAKYDNGKPLVERGYYNAYPLRSHKYMINEGGLRVPFIVKGPGIPGNTVSREPVISTDIYPTILAMLNLSKEVPIKVEGANLFPHLKSGGKSPINRNEPFLTFRYSKPDNAHDIAIIQGDYKLLRSLDNNSIFLWNIVEDMGESKNLVEDKPELTEKLNNLMTNYFNRHGKDD